MFADPGRQVNGIGMDRVRKMGSIAAILAVLPLPLLWFSHAFPDLPALENLVILSAVAGFLLAVVTVIYWVVLYRAKIRGRPKLNTQGLMRCQGREDPHK